MIKATNPKQNCYLLSVIFAVVSGLSVFPFIKKAPMSFLIGAYLFFSVQLTDVEAAALCIIALLTDIGLLLSSSLLS